MTSQRDRYSRNSTKDCIAGRENLLKSCHNTTRAATISPLTDHKQSQNQSAIVFRKQLKFGHLTCLSGRNALAEHQVEKKTQCTLVLIGIR